MEWLWLSHVRDRTYLAAANLGLMLGRPQLLQVVLTRPHNEVIQQRHTGVRPGWYVQRRSRC